MLYIYYIQTSQTVKKQGDKNFLASKNKQGVYEKKTYSEVLDLSEKLGSAVLLENLAPEIKEWQDYR